jgi:hypothetical protein
MRGVDPLLIDLAARECINVECRCGRVVQLAALPAHRAQRHYRCYEGLVVARPVPMPEM